MVDSEIEPGRNWGISINNTNHEANVMLSGDKIVHNDFLSAGFEARAIGYLADVGFYQKTVRELFPASKERDDALAGLGLGALAVAKRVNTYDLLFCKVPMKWCSNRMKFWAWPIFKAIIPCHPFEAVAVIIARISIVKKKKKKSERLARLLGEWN